MKSASWPHHDSVAVGTQLEPRGTRCVPDRLLHEEIPMFSEICDCLLLWRHRLDVLRLDLMQEHGDVSGYDFDGRDNGAMTVRRKRPQHHYQ